MDKIKVINKQSIYQLTQSLTDLRKQRNFKLAKTGYVVDALVLTYYSSFNHLAQSRD